MKQTCTNISKSIFVFLLAILFVVMLLPNCSHNTYSSFSKVTEGMKKDQVLDLLGSPLVSQRRQGNDSWIYQFYLDDEKIQKEIVFSEGSVTYAGDLKKKFEEQTEQPQVKKSVEFIPVND